MNTTRGWYKKTPAGKWHYFLVQDGSDSAGKALCGIGTMWRVGADDLHDTNHYFWMNCSKCQAKRRALFPDVPDRP